LRNRYVLQFFKVLSLSSHKGAKKWKGYRQGLGPPSPSHLGSSSLACGGLKPKPLSNLLWKPVLMGNERKDTYPPQAVEDKCL
jgi:hypothetical protein